MLNCLALLLTATLLVATGDARRTVPGAYIVQVDQTFAGLAKRQSPDQAVDTIVGRIKQKGVQVQNVRQKFINNGGLFSGFSISTSNASAAEIQAVQGVQKVWPVQLYDIPKPYAPKDGSRGSAAVHASSKRGLQGQELAEALLKRAPTGYSPDVFGPHTMTGVNITHANGQLGAGILVGIIDSGVDYTNPILGGCFGAGCHVVKGYDFVGNDYDGSNTPQPDADPFTDCNEHGTHVSGIVGALPNQYGFTGVAPLADLAMYRVFGCNGGAGDDVILAAMLRAANDGCNIVSMSLGGPGGFIDGDPLTVLADKLVSIGIPVVSAQGNDGAEGLWDGSSPANTLKGFAVGSVDVLDLTAYPGSYFGRQGGNQTVPYLAAKPVVISPALPIYFTSTTPTVTNDGCNPINQNLANKLTIIRRGTCNFAIKYTNVKNAGGRYAIIYNGPDQTTIPYQESFASGLTGVAGLTYDDGVKILNAYNANGGKLLWYSNIGPLLPGIVDTSNGGIMSDFSTYGPSNDMYSLPTLSAPGGNILSTFPLSMGGIGVISGTSMATPFISGSIAVLMSATKGTVNLSPIQIRSILSTTSKLTTQAVGDGSIRTAAQQGSGIVQLDKAVQSLTQILPDRFNLNDTAHFANTQSVQLINRNRAAVTYAFSNAPANSVLTYQNGVSDILPNPNPIVSVARANVAFSANSVTLQPGQSTTVTMTFSAPKAPSGDVSKYPVYSGYIRITGENGLVYNLPYTGLLGNIVDFPVLDNTDIATGIPYPYIVDNAGKPVPSSGTTTLTLGTGTTVHTRLAFGSRQVNVDLVSADTTFTPTVMTGGGSPQRVRERRAPQLYSDVPTIGNIAMSTNADRDQLFADPTNGFTETTFSFDGVYSTPQGASVQATAGTQYKILVRALRMTADPSLEASWDSWLSPAFTF